MSDLNVYTTAEINALTPITGDLVVDSTLNAVKLYDGAAWKTFNSSIAYENRWGASFDGAGYLDCGNDSSLSPANLTVSAWCKVSGSVDTYNYLLSKYGALYGSVYLRYTNANKFNFFLGFAGNTYKDGTFNTAVTLTDWHHVALTYDGSYIKGYVDGGEDYSIAETRPINYAPDGSGRDQFEIGRATYASQAEGLIDDVAIFDTALSGADITAIYNSGAPRDLTLAGSYDTDRTANLKGYWRMGDDSNDSPSSDPASNKIATITDSSGNGNDAVQATASKQPTFSDLTGEPIYV